MECLCLLPQTHLSPPGFQNPRLHPLKLSPNCLFGLFFHWLFHPTQHMPAICQVLPGPFTPFPLPVPHPPSPHTCCSPAWNSLPFPLSLSPPAPLPQPRSSGSCPSFKAQLECHFLPNASSYPASPEHTHCQSPLCWPCSPAPLLWLAVLWNTCLVGIVRL